MVLCGAGRGNSGIEANFMSNKQTMHLFFLNFHSLLPVECKVEAQDILPYEEHSVDPLREGAGPVAGEGHARPGEQPFHVGGGGWGFQVPGAEQIQQCFLTAV